jgi:hypothetical protein
MAFWDITPYSLVDVHRPDDGGSTHLWNVDLHSAISQKAIILKLAAVKTWNLKYRVQNYTTHRAS